MAELEPLGERLVVVPDPEPELVRGLYRPETAAAEVQSGVVESMGPLAVVALPGVGPGSRVVFPFYSGITLDVSGVKKKVFVPSELVGHLLEEDDAASS